MSIIYEALQKIEKKKINKPVFRCFYLFSVFKKILSVFILTIFIFGFLKFFDIFKNKKIFLEKNQNSIVNNYRKNTQPTTSLLSKKYFLQGIIYDNQRPIALINGKKLTIGSKIEDAKVVNIFADGVLLEDGEGKTYLSLD
ncbi:MAG: hypothetical protein NC925_02645 [Candidatus Omnitrophica bacterium]|nr:hypothetical protein [Candidatus Omnitrophota bacterium]MCM8831150.1 hypothetical protein [Candidatus Omnitrophota bacterium]